MVTVLSEEEFAASAKAKKFIVWLFVVTSSIMFGGWTSYYIVFAASKGKGHGLVLPDIFIYSTAVLVLSSVALLIATRAARNQRKDIQKTFLWITMIFGITFGILQYTGWQKLVAAGAFLVNNNASISMIYIVSGFHLLHILAGLGIISGCLLGAYKDIAAPRMKFRMGVATIFWHFIDILWIYLYVFLLLNR